MTAPCSGPLISHYEINVGEEKLHILCPSSLPMHESGKTFLHYFVEDEAFPLKVNLMRPYPSRKLTNKRHIFNYRLTCSQKIEDCTFGIPNAKFKIFKASACWNEETVNSIIIATVFLHNFKRTWEGLFCDVGESFTANQLTLPI